jgi:hypothetical protein
LREEGNVLLPAGSSVPDLGVDLVAGGEINLSSDLMLSGSGPTPRVADSDGVVAGAESAITLIRAFPVNTSILTGPSGRILDLMTQGPSGTNTSQVVSGADTMLWAERYPEPEGSLVLSPPDDFLMFDEFLRFMVGQSWYSSYETSGTVAHQAVVLQQILNLYWGYFLEPVEFRATGQVKFDPTTGEIAMRARNSRVRSKMAEAVAGYYDWLGERRFDPEAFRAYLGAEGGEAYQCINTLRNIVPLLDKLGLEPVDRERAKTALFKSIISKDFTYQNLTATLEDAGI